ncbi:hypothetical protein O181_081378 [Austropuccinia psidii MF-1]|uniref:Uncharacterized protein n=1 Tax=Austropuccinia psidii MF-1 TaxID=1389203 RepID=A0A9Q3FPR6_9BASI|nr:hypothetical protein [Austropuccinia psidii MF-1]
MEHGQQEAQPSIPLSRTWSKLPKGISQEIDFKDFMEITKGWNPTRKFRILEERETRLRENQATIQAIEEQLTQTGFQGKTRIQGQKQGLIQPKSERVRPNDPEAVVLHEISTQGPKIAENTSRISSPNNRNITPTQDEHSVVTPESNLNSDALWLQISQNSEQNQKKFAELQESHERIKKLIASMDKIVKSLQEGLAQLRKNSEETNKRLRRVSEELHHCKRDRDCPDEDLNKFFNVY